jgi:DNA mismatch repair ATPase MutS
MEIPELIGPGFINYHFQEEIGESGIAFNYKLLTGPSTTRNAIRLLQQAGYPTEIIEAAERRIQSLSG